MDVDDKEVMSRMTQMALEYVTLEIAKKAREFSLTLPHEVTGPQALRAFADSIESTNAKTWPQGRSN